MPPIIPGVSSFRDYAAAWLHVRPKRGAVVPFRLNAAQERLEREVDFARAQGRPVRFLILKARQLGFSTWALGRQYEYATTRFGVSALMAAHDDDSTKDLFERLRLMHDLSPNPPMTRYSSKKELDFANPNRRNAREEPGLNSKIVVATAGRGTMGRSRTLRFVHGSEVAFWENADRVLLAVEQTLPDDPDTFEILESTANGVGGEFFDRWQLASDPATRGIWRALFFPWFDDPEYAMDLVDGVMNPIPPCIEDHGAFVAEEGQLAGLHGLTDRQLNWRRYAIVNKCGNDMMKYRQEYPADCVTGDTRIATEQGMIRADAARSAQVVESGRISAWWEEAPAPVLKLTTVTGRVLRATPNHPVATPDGFVLMERLAPGQRILLRPPRFAEALHVEKWQPIPGAESVVRIDESWARFIGLFMGDGSWHKDTLSIVCDGKDDDVVSHVADLIEKLVGRPNRRVIARVQGRKGAVELRLGCKYARETFLRLGLVAADGAQSYRRLIHVPECIFRSPRAVVAQFLRGLFEADGSASGGRVRWASSKIEFAREIQLLLLGFGIPAVISSQTKTAGSGHQYLSHVISLGMEASALFSAAIGFIGERKGSVSYARAAATGRPRAQVALADEVLIVEPDGEAVTYNLTVEPEHVFSANGILTHNSMEAFLVSGRPIFNRERLRARERFLSMEDARRSKELMAPRWVRGDVVRSGGRATWASSADGPLSVYRWPSQGREYVVGGDPCKGVVRGKNPDSACLQVIDRHSWEQVAVWHGRVEAPEFARKMELVGYFWNRALLVPEANDHGHTVCVKLEEWSYPNLFLRHEIDMLGHEPLKRTGWENNSKTRPVLVDTITAGLNDGLIVLHDVPTIAELTTFVRNEKSGKAEADANCHDDRVIALGLALCGIHFYPAMAKASKFPDPAHVHPDVMMVARFLEKVRGEVMEEQRRRSA